MQNLKPIFLICLILLNFGALQANEPLVNSNKSVSANAKTDSPDVVGIVKGFFKWIFKGKSKVANRINHVPKIKNVVFDRTEITFSQNKIDLFVDGDDPDGDTLLYTYKVSAGKIVGGGRNIVWDLSEAEPGTHSITIEIDDGCGCVEPVSKEIKFVECLGCDASVPICPQGVVVTQSLESVKIGEAILFTANVEQLNLVVPSYNWTISGGELLDGQNTPNILVKAHSAWYKNVTATVDFGKDGCETGATASVKISEP